MMKIFSACLVTETNTFSPIPTGLNDFLLVRPDDINRGQYTYEDIQPVGLWHKKAIERGDEFVFPLFAFAQPSGLTTQVAYESLRDEILENLRAQASVDLVLLYLHGAMVANGYDDCEGDIIEQVRSIVGPDVVIAVELDLHCHLTEKMLSIADIIITFKEYPHVDINARAEELFTLALAAQQKKIQPSMALYDCRMMGMYPTNTKPMRQFIHAMVNAEQQQGILSVSFGHGFPFGDVPDAGGKIVVVTDNNLALAQDIAQSLGQQLFALRHEIDFPCLPLDKALSKAASLAADSQKPVVVADQSDNAGGGAPGDATYALAWLLKHKIQNVGMAIFYDPQVVTLALTAGIGAQLSVRLGGKLGPTSGSPLDLAVTITCIQRDYQHRFPQLDLETGEESNPIYLPIGDVVTLHCQGIDIVVNNQRAQCFSPCIFSDLGINPNSKSLLVVKSAQHFYGAFAPMATEVIYMAAPGAVPPIMQQIPYQRMRMDNKYPWVENPFHTEQINKIEQATTHE